jgi:hypothetical protein
MYITNKVKGNSLYISILIPNVNGINFPSKTFKLVEWTKNQNLAICYLQNMHLIGKDKNRLRVKE